MPITLRFLGDASHLERTISGVSHSVAGISGRMERAGQSMTRVGGRITAGLSAPLAFLGRTVGILGGEFEAAGNMFQAVSGATAEQFAEVDRLAIALGEDLSLPATSALDAMNAMTELAKAGLSVHDTMGAAKGVLQLAAAASIEEAEAATIAATALNAFGLSGDQAVRIADLLAATANASQAEITDVAAAFQMSAAVFAAAKVPVEDLTSAIALMANTGIRGSDAGTSLKTMLMRLQDPTAESARLMQRLGLDVYDAAGQLLPLRAIVGQFGAGLAGMTDEQRNAALATIFGADAIRAANAVLLGGPAAWDAMSTAVTRQGAAAELAAARTKGTLGAWEAVKSALESVAIELFRAFGPGVERFLRQVAVWIPKVAAWFQALPGPVKKFAGILALVVAVGGPILFVLGMVVTALSAVGGVLAAVASPVGLVIAALVALGAGLVVAYHRSEGFRAVVHAVVGAILEQLGNLVAWVRSVWPQFQEAIGHAFVALQKVGATFLLFWLTFGDEITAIVRFIVDVIRNVILFGLALINGDWGKAWDALVGIVRAVLGIIGQVLEAGLSLIRVAWDAAWEGIGLVVRNVWSGIVGAIRAGVNLAIGLINSLIEGYNAIPLLPNIGTIKPLGTPAGAGPVGLARGGILSASRPTPLLVGEGRGTEEVAAIPRHLGGLARLSGGTTVNVSTGGPVDPVHLAAEIAWALR